MNKYLLVVTMLVACGDNNATNRDTKDKVRITGALSGKRSQCYGVINGKLTNKYPGVVLLAREEGEYIVSRCTGTFVSDSTVITAAHCVGDSQTSMLVFVEDCAGGSDPVIANSTAVYHHGFTAEDFDAAVTPAAQNNLFKLDLAIVTFPPETATTFRELSAKRVDVDDEVHFVGFGVEFAPDHRDADKTIKFENIKKREGRNTVTEESMTYAKGTDNIAIIYDRNLAVSQAKGEYSNIAQGDSGGPLFLGDNLAGVTSSGSIVEIEGSTTDFGFFTDLHSDDSRQLITEVSEEGVTFTGLEAFLAGPEDDEPEEDGEEDEESADDGESDADAEES